MPRFLRSPDGPWLITAGQNDDKIAVLKIDDRHWQAFGTDQTVHRRLPVCVLLLPDEVASPEVVSKT